MKTIFFTFPILSLGLFTSNIVNAATLTWGADMCDYSGQYDNKKYDKNKLKGTLEVFDKMSSLVFQGHYHIEPNDNYNTTNIKRNDLVQTYEQQKREFISIPILDTKQAQEAKTMLLNSLDREFKIQGILFLASIDPKKSLDITPPVCRSYITPFLQSDKAVLTAWEQQTNKEYQEQQQYGEDIAQNVLQRYNEEKRTNALGYAKVNLIGNALNNCLVDNYEPEYYYYDAITEKRNNFVKTIFGKTVKKTCEEI